MKSKIYYGEYSLEHWIRLMLTGNIVRPEYQRSFVWNEEDIVRLIKSLDDGYFVQPVTIAQFTDNNNETKNIILDGQQRLTSILLAKIGLMPNKVAFDEAQLVGEEYTDDYENEDNGPDVKRPEVIEWTFSELLSKDGKDTIKSILDDIKDKKDKDGKSLYIPLDDKIKSITTDDFFKETFLGFSYIVEEADNVEESQKDFSTIFRNMNYFGKKLNTLESRKALYYVNTKYFRYLEGLNSNDEDVLCGLRLKENMSMVKIDFVRYLSMLSQYKVTGNKDKIMVGFASYKLRESFYADYVAYLVRLEQETRKDKFDGFEFATVFPNDCLQERLDNLHDFIDNSKDRFFDERKQNKSYVFPSCIDADYWLIGLIYWILFEGKKIAFGDDLRDKIKKAIRSKKKDGTYTKSPNRLGYLRERIYNSISIYEEFVINDQS